MNVFRGSVISVVGLAITVMTSAGLLTKRFPPKIGFGTWLEAEITSSHTKWSSKTKQMNPQKQHRDMMDLIKIWILNPPS